MRNVASTLNKVTYLYGFTPFSYVVREIGGYVDHMNLAQDTMFMELCYALVRIQ